MSLHQLYTITRPVGCDVLSPHSTLLVIFTSAPSCAKSVKLGSILAIAVIGSDSKKRSW